MTGLALSSLFRSPRRFTKTLGAANQSIKLDEDSPRRAFRAPMLARRWASMLTENRLDEEKSARAFEVICRNANAQNQDGQTEVTDLG